MNTLKKHKVLDKRRRSKDIVITRPDNGNGIVDMDRVIYNQEIYALLSDKNKFKKLSEDPKMLLQGQLQRYLRELKKRHFLDAATYDRIYPSGLQPSRLYGTPKIHKMKYNFEVPSFRPTVSSIGSFNYNLSRFLCNVLTPFIPTGYNT